MEDAAFVGAPSRPVADRWLSCLRRYLAVFAAGNVAWEGLQMPLYTLWNEGTAGQILAYGVHCAVGDLVVGVSALAFALVLLGNPAWPRLAYVRVALATLIVGLTYTIWSEWYNVQIAGNWAYSDAMPQIPGSGIGLSPLAQWIVIPLAAFWWAKR